MPNTIRDLIAALIALFLFAVAFGLVTGLKLHKRHREVSRDRAITKGQIILAELPTENDLILFSEDRNHFYYGDKTIAKDQIQSAQLLINGSPLASCVSSRLPITTTPSTVLFENQPEGIARDRWDVVIKTPRESMLIECGAIRERVSQELAKKVFEAVKQHVED